MSERETTPNKLIETEGMKTLPDSEVYEQEFKYFPWGVLIERVIAVAVEKTLRNGKAIDLMCGPGYLLARIQQRRPDLELKGLDISEEFISSAGKKYQGIEFERADVLEWQADKNYDLILCTGGVHHLPYEKQPEFFKKAANLLGKDGLFIFADSFIDDFASEEERKLAAAKLGYGYLATAIKKGAPEPIIKAAVDILHNDVMGFEFKTSVNKMGPIMEENFTIQETTKTWPEEDSAYGDYLFVLKRKK